jgi:MFS superfamily sulfate permease-like transporter
VVVLSLEESSDLDSTALESLADFASWLTARDIALRVARLKDAVRALLQRVALPELPSSALNFWSVEDAAMAPTKTPLARGSAE